MKINLSVPVIGNAKQQLAAEILEFVFSKSLTPDGKIIQNARAVIDTLASVSAVYFSMVPEKQLDDAKEYMELLTGEIIHAAEGCRKHNAKSGVTFIKNEDEEGHTIQ